MSAAISSAGSEVAHQFDNVNGQRRRTLESLYESGRLNSTEALNFVTGLPLINLRYKDNKVRRNSRKYDNVDQFHDSFDESTDIAANRIAGFTSVDAWRALQSRYILACSLATCYQNYVASLAELYADNDCVFGANDDAPPTSSNYYPNLSNLGNTDFSFNLRSDSWPRSKALNVRRPNERNRRRHSDNNPSSPRCSVSPDGKYRSIDRRRASSPSFRCYVSLRNTANDSPTPPSSDPTTDDSLSAALDRDVPSREDTLSVPPLITVYLPSNCLIIKDKNSLSMDISYLDGSATTTRMSSLSSLFEESSSSLFDDDPSSLANSANGDSLFSSSADSATKKLSESEATEPSLINIVSVPPPPDRQWIINRTLENDAPIGSFTIMSYNILCDKYATSNVYAYCPSWALTWDYRKKYVLSEITRHDSDIVALQEVETEQFYKFFKPELAPRGYSGTFSPKSRAKTMPEDERKFVDGCAIFWKSDKFDLEKEDVIEFTRLAIAKAEGNEQMLNRVMTRDNIALIATFKIRENVYPNGAAPASSHLNVVNSPLVVCTAHIHWDPEFCDVKLVQAMMLVQELTSVVERTAEQCHLPMSSVPVVVCGDLNSLPESGVYEYLTTGKISADHADFKEFKGQSCIQKLSTSPYMNGSYSHKLKLKSTYEANTVPFTNYTYDFKGVIDYIFGTPGLVRLGVLGPMDFSWFQDNKIVGCPFPGIPSDHIPLMVHYAIVPSSLSRFSSASQLS